MLSDVGCGETGPIGKVSVGDGVGPGLCSRAEIAVMDWVRLEMVGEVVAGQHWQSWQLGGLLVLS